MAKIIFPRDSKEFLMFKDFWGLVQEYWGVEGSDEYWQNVVNGCEEFCRKYNTDFAKDLALTYLEELERKYKCE